MTRKEFLSITGMSIGAFVFATHLTGCKKSGNPYPGPTNVDFNIDLSQSSNNVLTTAGGYLVQNGVIVANAGSGKYVAVSAMCTHQGVQVQFDLSNKEFHCPAHGSNFSETGSIINGPASYALDQYNTALSGNILHVFS